MCITFQIASHDVAHNQKTLEEYGVTHILNLASDEIENLYEDEYNYCSLDIVDEPTTRLKDYYDEAFEFIDEGRHRGYCLVHCDGSPGLSRSTAICVAYLMTKQKLRYADAHTEV